MQLRRRSSFVLGGGTQAAVDSVLSDNADASGPTVASPDRDDFRGSLCKIWEVCCRAACGGVLKQRMAILERKI